MPKVTSDGFVVIGDNTHLVHFQPIAVPKEVAEELQSYDPLGKRIKLEIKLLKKYCPRPVATQQKREPYPVIDKVVEMTEDELHDYNVSNKPPYLR